MGSVYEATIKRYYPNAMTTNQAVDLFLTMLERKLGLRPEQIMAADSICSDDLNSIQYPKRALEMLGPFRMGGLNGFPFTGLTGMGAFAHHVPDGGAVFVFHGPHVGISKSGEFGEIVRPGQEGRSACCGAAKAALSKLLRGEIKPGEVSELDYQQNQIEQLFLQAEERIRTAKEPLQEATEVMYEAIAGRVSLLAERTNYPTRWVILVGGILINTDRCEGSWVSVRRFSFCDAETDEETDLLPAMEAELAGL